MKKLIIIIYLVLFSLFSIADSNRLSLMDAPPSINLKLPKSSSSSDKTTKIIFASSVWLLTNTVITASYMNGYNVRKSDDLVVYIGATVLSSAICVTYIFN